MRTRRSARNQQRLYAGLGRDLAVAARKAEEAAAAIRADERRKLMLESFGAGVPFFPELWGKDGHECEGGE